MKFFVIFHSIGPIQHQHISATTIHLIDDADTEQMEIDSLSQLSTSIEQNLTWIPCIYLKSTHFSHPLSETQSV